MEKDQAKVNFRPDASFLLKLSPPITTIPNADAFGTVEQKIKSVEKYYNEYYDDHNDIPYNAKMARAVLPYPSKKQRIGSGEASRLSRDKTRFVSTRLSDDVEILNGLMSSAVDDALEAEAELNAILGRSKLELINLVDFFDNEMGDDDDIEEEIDNEAKEAKNLSFGLLFKSLMNDEPDAMDTIDIPKVVAAMETTEVSKIPQHDSSADTIEAADISDMSTDLELDVSMDTPPNTPPDETTTPTSITQVSDNTNQYGNPVKEANTV